MPRECIGPFRERLTGSLAESAGLVEPVAFADLLDAMEADWSACVFTGLSLASEELRELAMPIASGLRARSIQVLNSPCSVQPRQEVRERLTSGVRRSWGLSDLPRDLDSPVSLVCDDLLGNTDSPALCGQELCDACVRMVLVGFAPSRIRVVEVLPWEVDSPHGRQAFVVMPGVRPPAAMAEAAHEAGLDFCRVEFTVNKGRAYLWRIDDSPLALLPGRACSAQEAARYRQALEAICRRFTQHGGG
ncbi:MAG TPA: hypothetical protein VMI31_06930 [Fimbriimonadaceae bacterium]|nr:hypothetical protein [Fimbriimonadaceae bacterium]